MYVPDRVGRVLYCDGKCTESTITNLNWMKPSQFKSGLTISFWIKLRPGEVTRQSKAYKKYTYIIYTKKKEFYNRYSNLNEEWVFAVFVSSKNFIGSFPMDRRISNRWNYIAMSYNPEWNENYLEGDYYFRG